MAEAGQKDQTGNEAVAVDNAAPQTLNEVTGFSSASPTPVESNPTPQKPSATQPENTGPVAGEQAAAPQEDTNGAKAKPEDSISKSASAEKPSEDTAKKSKFLEDSWQDTLLRTAWNMDKIDPNLQNFVTNVEQDPKNGTLFFKTKHGHFDWGKTADGTEFIGRHGLFNRLTQDLADEEALVAKSRGWKAVTVHGSESNKDKLWLGAMRAGIEVANHTPSPEILEIWKKENGGKLTGFENAAETPKNAPKNDAPETPATAAPTDAAPVVEEPKAAEPPKTDEPQAAEPPKNDAPETPATAAPTDAAPVVEEPKATEPPKTDEPQAAEPPKNDAPETPAAAAPTDAAPVVEEPKAAEPPKTDEPKAAEPPKAEEPKATEPPKADTPGTLNTKFGAVEPPKADEPKAAEPPKVNPAHAQWEKDKALFSSKPEGHEVSPEGRRNVEAVEGMSKRAAEVQDPTHRAGIEKLQDAIKSGKVKVDGEIERGIINNVDSPEGFKRAADYFSNKAGSDLGLPKVEAPAAPAAKSTATQNKPPVNKGPA
ncbi:MAG: hypothetical protein ACK4PK_06285 [Alphaproteobacteria bacterium]